MKCTCGGKTRVLHTRDTIRRRECMACGKRFNTREQRDDSAKLPPPKPRRRHINWNNPFGL